MSSPSAAPARVPRLSYFFPAHNEEANLEPLVVEALGTLPDLARTFEIVIVDDGSRDATPSIADRLAAEHPEVVRAVHHPVNLGYGAALRSGFQAARYDVVAFTDGDRQFKVADLGLLMTDRPPPPPRSASRPAFAGVGMGSAKPPLPPPNASKRFAGNPTRLRPACFLSQ